MTTIAYRNGIIAADSRLTTETDGAPSRFSYTEKLFRKTLLIDGIEQEAIIATEGESDPGMLFMDWLGTGRPESDLRGDFLHAAADFTILVLKQDGLWEYSQWMRAQKILDPYYSIGSGAAAALAAMAMGAGAVKAVEIACGIDPYTARPVKSMRLKNESPKQRRKIMLPIINVVTTKDIQ